MANYLALDSNTAIERYELDDGGVPFPVTLRYFYLP
jgi:hypothetical protein